MISWDKYTRYNEKGRKVKFFKLYPEKLKELYDRKENGESNIQIARIWGLHHSTISAQWKKYLGLGKKQSEYVTLVSVRIVQKSKCLVPDEGPRNQGHTYKEYLQLERDKKFNRLLKKGGKNV